MNFDLGKRKPDTPISKSANFEKFNVFLPCSNPRLPSNLESTPTCRIYQGQVCCHSRQSWALGNCLFINKYCRSLKRSPTSGPCVHLTTKTPHFFGGKVEPIQPCYIDSEKRLSDVEMLQSVWAQRWSFQKALLSLFESLWRATILVRYTPED